MGDEDNFPLSTSDHSSNSPPFSSSLPPSSSSQSRDHNGTNFASKRVENGVEERKEGKKEKRVKLMRHVFGVILLLCVVFIWVAGSELMQFIFLEEDFEKPFFLTYCSTASLSVYLIIAAVKNIMRICWRF